MKRLTATRNEYKCKLSIFHVLHSIPSIFYRPINLRPPKRKKNAFKLKNRCQRSQKRIASLNCLSYGRWDLNTYDDNLFRNEILIKLFLSNENTSHAKLFFQCSNGPTQKIIWGRQLKGAKKT